MEPEICTKMIKKTSEKLGAKFPATTPSCSMAASMTLSQNFFNRKQAQQKVNHCRRKKRKEEKGKGKKKSKIEKPKDVGHLVQNFDLCTCLSQNVIKRDSSGKKGQLTCCQINAFLTRLKLIWPKSSLKITKMSKKRIFGKKFQESMG